GTIGWEYHNTRRGRRADEAEHVPVVSIDREDKGLASFGLKREFHRRVLKWNFVPNDGTVIFELLVHFVVLRTTGHAVRDLPVAANSGASAEFALTEVVDVRLNRFRSRGHANNGQPNDEHKRKTVHRQQPW